MPTPHLQKRPRRSYGLAIAMAIVLTALAGIMLQSRAADKAGNPNLGKIRHVVLYAHKEGTTEEQVKEIEAESRKLIDSIDQILDYEWGTHVGSGPLSQGYTHCLMMTFENESTLKEYVAHPAHQAFVKLAFPHLEKMLVIDYKAQS